MSGLTVRTEFRKLGKENVLVQFIGFETISVCREK
jgi:hypothetical protein